MSLAEDLERFRRGAEVLATVLTGAAGEEVDYTPAPDKWTIRQIMAHLADAELVGAHRLRLVIAENNPRSRPSMRRPGPGTWTMRAASRRNLWRLSGVCAPRITNC